MQWQYLIINILLGRGNMPHCQAMGKHEYIGPQVHWPTPVMRGKVKIAFTPLTGHVKAGHVTNLV